jgi:hypothetical protein
MSNIRDGGTIVIGVEEENERFIPTGVSATNSKSYKIDEMRDQLASFCDPSPEFRVDFPKDSTGRLFVVISIAPFRDLPLLAKKGISGVITANAIYYRNTNKRVESAPISNTHDLRDLIELAARNLIRRRTDLGWQLPSAMEEIFNANLAALPEQGLLAKIKAAAYWEVEFRPNDDQAIPKLKELRQKVDKAAVRINWPIPYYSHNPGADEGLRNGDGYIEGFASQWYTYELWRLYTSGHFILFRMLRADAGLLPVPSPSQGTFVSMLDSVVYFLTEIVEFLSRLAEGGLYATGVDLQLKLNHVQGRLLYLDDPRRSPLYSNRIADEDIIHLSRATRAEELQADSLVISRSLIMEVLEAFTYTPPEDLIQKLQVDYIGSRGSGS